MWRQRISSHYLSGTLPYVRRHITVHKNVLSASLNKTFPISYSIFENKNIIQNLYIVLSCVIK